MTALGMHFAVEPELEARLLSARTDDEVMEIVEEIEETCDLDFATDKAWDALHRCLSDGTLWTDRGTYPLSHAVLGGLQLHDGEDYLVAYVSRDEVPDVATALTTIDRAWLRERYNSLDFPDYQGHRGDDDFEYTWRMCRGLDDFYCSAAKRGCAVIFTVDQ